MGDQASDLTIVRNGDSFTGTQSGVLGSLDISNGQIKGNQIFWTLETDKPMRLVVQCEATVEGDSFTGQVKAGVFGTYAITGTRQAG